MNISKLDNQKKYTLRFNTRFDEFISFEAERGVKE